MGPRGGREKNEVRVQDVEDVDVGSGGLGFRSLGSRFQVFSRPQAQGLGLRVDYHRQGIQRCPCFEAPLYHAPLRTIVKIVCLIFSLILYEQKKESKGDYSIYAPTATSPEAHGKLLLAVAQRQGVGGQQLSQDELRWPFQLHLEPELRVC